MWLLELYIDNFFFVIVRWNQARSVFFSCTIPGVHYLNCIFRKADATALKQAIAADGALGPGDTISFAGCSGGLYVSEGGSCIDKLSSQCNFWRNERFFRVERLVVGLFISHRFWLASMWYMPATLLIKVCLSHAFLGMPLKLQYRNPPDSSSSVQPVHVPKGYTGHRACACAAAGARRDWQQIFCVLPPFSPIHALKEDLSINTSQSDMV